MERSLSATTSSAPGLAEEVNEPDQARSPIEQILSRGGEGQAHVTFAEISERAPGRDGYVLALDK